jgi:superfamily II DNA helicase RecQ
MFYSWADVKLHERFLDNLDDDDLRRQTRAATVALFDLAERKKCRHQALVAHFDEGHRPCSDACDVCSGAGIDVRIAELGGSHRRKASGGVARRLEQQCRSSGARA